MLKLPPWLRPKLRTPPPGSVIHPDLPYELLSLRDFATVGDTVTKRAWSLGLEPRVAVFDCREQRIPSVCPEPPEGYEVVELRNPPGCISCEALELLKEVPSKIAIRVEGEEDLLALVLIAYAEPGFLVVYGQPFVGVVVVEVTEWLRGWARSVMACFD